MLHAKSSGNGDDMDSLTVSNSGTIIIAVDLDGRNWHARLILAIIYRSQSFALSSIAAMAEYF